MEKSPEVVTATIYNVGFKYATLKTEEGIIPNHSIILKENQRGMKLNKGAKVKVIKIGEKTEQGKKFTLYQISN